MQGRREHRRPASSRLTYAGNGVATVQMTTCLQTTGYELACAYAQKRGKLFHGRISIMDEMVLWVSSHHRVFEWRLSAENAGSRMHFIQKRATGEPKARELKKQGLPSMIPHLVQVSCRDFLASARNGRTESGCRPRPNVPVGDDVRERHDQTPAPSVAKCGSKRGSAH